MDDFWEDKVKHKINILRYKISKECYYLSNITTAELKVIEYLLSIAHNYETMCKLEEILKEELLRK